MKNWRKKKNSMNSPHIECIHHESHDNRLNRAESDIRDLNKKVEVLDSRLDKISVDVAKIVGLITGAGAIVNFIMKAVE